MKVCSLSAVIYLVLVACPTSHAKGGIGRVLIRILGGRGRSGSHSTGSSLSRWPTNSLSRFRSSSNRDFSSFRSKGKSSQVSKWKQGNVNDHPPSYFDRPRSSQDFFESRSKSHNVPPFGLKTSNYDGHSNFVHPGRLLQHKSQPHSNLPKQYPQPYNRYASADSSQSPPPYAARENPPPYSTALSSRHGPQQSTAIKQQSRQNFGTARSMKDPNAWSSMNDPKNQHARQNNAGMFEMYHHPYLVPVNHSRSIAPFPKKSVDASPEHRKSLGLLGLGTVGTGITAAGTFMDSDILNSEDCEIGSIIGKYSNRIRWDCLRTKSRTTCRITCSNEKEHFPEEPKTSREYVCSKDGKWTPKIIPPCV